MKQFGARYCLLVVFVVSLCGFARADSLDVNVTIKRLKPHIEILEQFNTKNKLLKLLPYKAPNRFIFIDDIADFTHGLLRICVKKMLNEESLDPLFVMWRLFITEYQDVESEIFLREMSILLFSIYKNIFTAYLQNRSVATPAIDAAFLQSAIALYQRVSVLPIKEILEILDDCLVQFTVIMKDYGIDENKTWIAWLKKYWWVPPVVVSSMFFSIIKNFAQSVPMPPAQSS
ncbi:hypothetical protein KJZ61_03120 [Candidatus Dependentiae bacterium]|nr:hypothetical protein [Candidatus Dependentiae bacterium]